MKKMLITLVVMLCSMGAQAQKISCIETTKSWYYIYDERGKKIKTISRTVGEIKGYSANFYIIRRGSWIHTYDPAGKKLHTFSVSSVGDVVSVTGDTFTTQKGSWYHTWSKDGKKISTRVANR